MIENTKWKTPAVEDIQEMYRIAELSEAEGCDASATNIFLYRERYCTKICLYNGFLLRRYQCRKHLKGYGFPLGNGNLQDAINFVVEDAKMNNDEFSFVLVSEKQKNLLDTEFPGKFVFTENRDDADYVYLRESLANLSGKKYHKKKNHVSQFCRKYSDQHYEPLSLQNREDAWRVEERWYAENKNGHPDDLKYEKKIIRESLENMEILDMRGGILYAEEKAVAMTLGSPVTNGMIDTHFEKAIEGYDKDGAYATVNRYFAESLKNFTYINREEDLGLEGLRKAKLSYHPEILLLKYTAVLR